MSIIHRAVGRALRVFGNRQTAVRGGPRVAVTYANEKMPDGSCAQLQRIYGIYAISRFLDIPYIHSPLLHIGYQGICAVEDNATDPDLEKRYNAVFTIPSDVELPQEHIVHKLKHVDTEMILRLKRKAETGGVFRLLRITLPYGITDKHPDAYEVVKLLSPFDVSPSSTFRIAIHVRKGDLLFANKGRLLPNDYYISVAKQIADILDRRNVKYVLELHTDLPTKRFTVTPDHPVAYVVQLKEVAEVDAAEARIQDFDVLPNLEKHINTDPIEALERMVTADVLILSHSSFSYVAALLNRQGTIIYHNFWHSPLKSWLIAEDDGRFPTSDFVERLRIQGIRS